MKIVLFFGKIASNLLYWHLIREIVRLQVYRRLFHIKTNFQIIGIISLCEVNFIEHGWISGIAKIQ